MAAFAALGGDEDESNEALVMAKASPDDVRTGAAIDKALMAQQQAAVSGSAAARPIIPKSVSFAQINSSGHFLVDLLGKEFVYKPHPDEDEVRALHRGR